MNKKLSPEESKAYKRFELTIERSLNLISLFETMSKLRDATRHKALSDTELLDIVRAAIVLSIAAMDSYFTDVFCEKVPSYLANLRASNKRIPPEMVATLEAAGVNTATALEILVMKHPYRRIHALLSSHLENHTTQKFEVVDRLFLAYELKNATENAERHSKRRSLRKRVKALVQRRHRIAHGGDLNKHGKLQALNVNNVRRQILELNRLVSSFEFILARKVS